jgi:hypothetical protein
MVENVYFPKLESKEIEGNSKALSLSAIIQYRRMPAASLLLLQLRARPWQGLFTLSCEKAC